MPSVPVKPSAKSKLKGLKVPQRRIEPVWRGPEQDGVTFSLLSRFLVCRERFRLLVVEGLKTAEQFYAPIDFGNMWHACEEALAGREDWRIKLEQHCSSLCAKFRFQQEQIDHWYNVAKALFPLYVEHWAEHPDVADRTPLLQEQPFNVPYQLPSGRTVRLRGKWDSVDLIGKGKAAGVYLQENKTKSGINAQLIQQQLRFDLQTMIYVVALQERIETDTAKTSILGGDFGPVRGVRYNVIRRSAHKSVESMLKKLEEDRGAGRIGEWFARWKVEIAPADVTKFRRECLDPILENLCDWWEQICEAMIQGSSPFSRNRVHWRHPYGVYNVLDEGGSSDLDRHLETGSEVGLQRTNDLFPELTTCQ